MPPCLLPAWQASAIGEHHSCRAKMNGTRAWLCGELAKDGRPFVPSQANFVMIDMDTDVRPIIDQFAGRNILVGRRFPSMNNFLRITIGTQQEMETFVTALREIAPSLRPKLPDSGSR